MAMACCHKEYAEGCEILVCEDTPAPHNPNLYSRLLFGLLASSWLPIPLGIFLWSALHVMLLIVGPIFWLLGLLIIIGYTGFLFIVAGIEFVVAGLIAVAVDMILLPARLLPVRSIRFCWSLVSFLVCHEPTVEWRGVACLTALVWKNFQSEMREIFWEFVPIIVPCLNSRRNLHEMSENPPLKMWSRWCDEVVHKHEAIAI